MKWIKYAILAALLTGTMVASDPAQPAISREITCNDIHGSC